MGGVLKKRLSAYKWSNLSETRQDSLGPRSLKVTIDLWTNRKSHIRALISVKINDLVWPWRVIMHCFKTRALWCYLFWSAAFYGVCKLCSWGYC